MQIDLAQQHKISCISWTNSEKNITWKMKLWCILLTIRYNRNRRSWNIPTLFLCKIIQSCRKQSNNTWKTLTKKNIEKLLNQIFTNVKNENKSRIEVFIDENERKNDCVDRWQLFIKIFFYRKLLTLDSCQMLYMLNISD